MLYHIFFDLELRDDGIALYAKQTNTGLYINYNSNILWAFRVSQIESLTTRAKNICSPVYLKGELESIKPYASWNNFTKYVTSNIIKKDLNKKISDHVSNQSNQNPLATIWFRLPYCGVKSVQKASLCVKKIKRYCKKDINIKFKFLYETTRLEFFCKKKIKHPFSIIRLYCTPLIAQDAVLVMLGNYNGHHMNVALSMLGVIKTMKLQLILTNMIVSNILKILCLWIDYQMLTSQHQTIVT